jgi:hypothetical protein
MGDYMKTQHSPTSHALRLYHFIMEAQQQRSLPVVEFINTYSGQKKNYKQIHQYIIYVIELLESIEFTITSIDGINHELYTKEFHLLHGFTNIRNIDAAIATYSDKVTPSALRNLEFCHDIMYKNFTEHDEGDKVLGVLAQIDKLLLEVAGLGVSDIAKNATIDILNAARNCLLDYKIRGIDALIETIDVSMIKIYKTYKLMEPYEEECKPKFEGVFSTVADIITVASSPAALPQSFEVIRQLIS